MLLEDMLNAFIGKYFCLLNSFALIKKCHLFHRKRKKKKLFRISSVKKACKVIRPQIEPETKCGKH